MKTNVSYAVLTANANDRIGYGNWHSHISSEQPQPERLAHDQPPPADALERIPKPRRVGQRVEHANPRNRTNCDQGGL
jgi:hypothetical protein